MNSTLEEIIRLAKATLVVADEAVIDTQVQEITKKSFVTVGGMLDMIILTAEDALVPDPTQDNIDRPERHNIAGTMNSPSERQKEAFKLENGDVDEI